MKELFESSIRASRLCSATLHAPAAAAQTAEQEQLAGLKFQEKIL